MSAPRPNAALAREPAEVVELLYERHHRQVLHLAMRYGGGRRAWAEDVVQEVFLSLLGALDRLREVDDLGAWFYRVTTRRCLTKLRRERWRTTLLGRWFLAGEGPDLEARIGARRELTRALWELEQLPPKERVAFAMFHLDGKEVAEIGRQLGHSKGYVSKLIARAEAKIGRSR
jgi:RNA polymerase sigma-70 factor (ECF subfamily)